MKRDRTSGGEPDLGAEATFERGAEAVRDAARESGLGAAAARAGGAESGPPREGAGTVESGQGPWNARSADPDADPGDPDSSQGAETASVNDSPESQYLDQLQRLRAEFDNFRKRTLRDKEQWWRRAKADLLTELLPILDDSERARAFAAAGNAPDAEGLLQILRKFKETLTQLGLEAMETGPGTSFDPEFHEAFMTTPSAEIEEGQIVSTLEAGYRFEGEILRRSKVSVSAGRPTEDP